MLRFMGSQRVIPLLVPRLQMDLTLPPVPETGGATQDLAEESLGHSSCSALATGQKSFPRPPSVFPSVAEAIQLKTTFSRFFYRQ